MNTLKGHKFHKTLNTISVSDCPRNKSLSRGKDGLKADNQGLAYITKLVQNIKPDIVLLELGTNEETQAQLEEQVGHLVTNIFTICCELFKRGV